MKTRKEVLGMSDARCMRLAEFFSIGELYRQLDIDMTGLDAIITNPADKACAEMSLADLLCWLKVCIRWKPT